MSIRNAPLFTPDGRPTPLFMAQWIRRGPAQPILSTLRLVENGMATDDFRRLWDKAFPSRPPLPKDRIANADLTASDGFWFVFA